jgi:hypothetical protein
MIELLKNKVLEGIYTVTVVVLLKVEWTQNNLELELRHGKRRREVGKGKESKMANSLSAHV